MLLEAAVLRLTKLATATNPKRIAIAKSSIISHFHVT
jgi:hypothetical protein